MGGFSVVDRLLDVARLFPAIIGGGQASEAEAVRVLADDARGDARRLRELAYRLQQDPDAVPLSVALLLRAAESLDARGLRRGA